MTWQADIQANVLRGVRATHARYLFLRFEDPSPGERLRRFLRAALPQVRDARWQRDRFPPGPAAMDHPILNLALTRHAFDALGSPYESDELRRGHDGPPTDAFAERTDLPDELVPGMQWLDPDAANSMYRRLDLLGEAPIVGADHTPRHSWRWNPRVRIDALAWYSGPDPSSISACWTRLAGQPGVTVVHDREANTLPGLVDWFGFADGISQPAVAGFHDHAEVFGRGAWTRHGWRGLAPGEFVVGEPDEGGERRRPGPGGVLHNSTYLVFREIQMWPDRLRAMLESYEAATGMPGDVIASWLVGRHRPGEGNDGTSLMVEGPAEDRDFIYGFDPEGVRCPLGAHVRRANPRDSLGRDGVRSNRHRLIRRGMTYQDGGEVGLAFVALQARIEDQFEFVQSHWLNAGPTLHVGQDPDPIAGNARPGVPTPRFVRPGTPTVVVPLERPDPFGQPLTAVRGGEYFVLPTLAGLAELAGL